MRMQAIRKRINLRGAIPYGIVAILAVAAVPAFAVNGTWTGGAGAIWDTNATNWSNVTGTPWDSTNGTSNTAVFNTANFASTVSGTVWANAITFNATGTVSSGTITLVGTTPTITATSSRTATISSSLAGSAGLTITGGGTLALTGANTYSGTTSFTSSATTLVLGNASALGTSVLAGRQTLVAGIALTGANKITNNLWIPYAASGTFTISGSNAIDLSGTATFNGAGAMIINNTGATTFSGPMWLISGTQNQTINFGGAGNFTISGAIGIDASGTSPTGWGNLRYGGTGTMTLSGSNTFGGNLSVFGGGAVSFANATALGTAGYVQTGTSGSPGTLLYTGAGGSTNKAVRVGINTGDTGMTGILDQSGGGLLSYSSVTTSATNATTPTASGTLVLQGSTSGTGQITGAVGQQTSVTLSVVKQGSGVWLLSGANTYSGATSITGGRLEITAGNINASSGITLNGAGAELRYNSSTALTAPLTFTQGTLSGTGTIGTAVTAGANDILSPGNSPGAQSFTSGLTWDPGGTYLWEINNATSTSGTGWDIINVSGGSGLVVNSTSGSTFRIAITSLSGTAAGNAANFSATTSGSWTILSSASGITGFVADKFTLDRSAFTNTSSGTFTLSQVASGGNQTLVLAYNTLSALSSSTSSITGFRVMQGQSTTTSVNLLNAGPDATGYALSPSAALSLVSGSTGTLAASGTQAISFGYASTAATGARSGTVSFTNTGNSGDATGSISVSGAVVTNRVVTASAVNFGLVHLGASGTATSSFTSVGSDNDYTRITVTNGSGGGFTVSGSDGYVFDGSGSANRTLAGTFTTAGALSGTISLSNASAEAAGNLPGQVPGTTSLTYSASVFSGTATWNVAGGGSWGSGASSNWTNTGGVQAAPGTFAGYSNTDSATFAGTQGGTSTILLDGATPSLAALVFSNTTGRYVIDQGSGGSLTLAAPSGKPTVDVAAGALHEIKAAILGSSGLDKIGGGTLVLSGSNGFSGGTDITNGVLVVNGFVGGAVAVSNGAMLAGSGQLGGLVTVASGAILAPGNSPGTLTMTSGLSLADAAILNFELSGTNFTVGGGINDLVAVTGDLVLDGVLNVAAIGGGDFAGVASSSQWTILTYTGVLTNNGLTLGSLPSLGGNGRYYAIDTSTSGQVNLVVVPEPGSLVLAGIGIVAVGGIVSRRRRRVGR